MEHTLALTEWQIVDTRKLEIVCDIIPSDRLLQAAVEKVRRVLNAPRRVRVGQDLRERIGRLHGQTVCQAFGKSRDHRVVSRMAAVVALTCIRIDNGVLRERPKRLGPGGARAQLW